MTSLPFIGQSGIVITCGKDSVVTTGLLEAYVIDASKPHHPRAAIQLELVNPRPPKLAGLRIQRDVKVKARAVAKEAWAGGFDFEA